MYISLTQRAYFVVWYASPHILYSPFTIVPNIVAIPHDFQYDPVANSSVEVQ